MSDEFARIARIAQLLRSSAPQIALGIGDDAAVLTGLHGQLALSVDASVEHVHFERAFASLGAIGARAFSAALSDLAAMGARPSAALSSVCLPAELSDAELELLMTGIARAAQQYACPVVGGNLSRASELSVTTTVIGELSGRALTRAGARVGDGVYVTGTLGAAGLGLLLLQAGRAQEGAPFVERWRNPIARIDAGLRLVDIASAAIDVSDGALQDLTHLCEASGVGATIDATCLPLLPDFEPCARRLGQEPVQLALCAGEDYELLFTTAKSAAGAALGQRIGVITEASAGICVRDAQGQPIALRARGYRHFGG